jgi:hypothetical protein
MKLEGVPRSGSLIMQAPELETSKLDVTDEPSLRASVVPHPLKNRKGWGSLAGHPPEAERNS